MQVYDADVFIASVTAPLLLPNEFTFTLSHSYVSQHFPGGRNLISYSNTPTVHLNQKQVPMEDGNMLILSGRYELYFLQW